MPKIFGCKNKSQRA